MSGDVFGRAGTLLNTLQRARQLSTVERIPPSVAPGPWMGALRDNSRSKGMAPSEGTRARLGGKAECSSVQAPDASRGLRVKAGGEARVTMCAGQGAST